MKLARWESAWAEAAMQAIFPGSPEDGLPGIRDMGLEAFVAEVMRYLPFRAALGMRVAIWLVALAPLFVLGKPRTISTVSAADGERVVTKLVGSKVYLVRSLVLILKTMGALLYGGSTSLRARLMSTPLPASGIRRVTGDDVARNVEPISV